MITWPLHVFRFALCYGLFATIFIKSCSTCPCVFHLYMPHCFLVNHCLCQHAVSTKFYFILYNHLPVRKQHAKWHLFYNLVIMSSYHHYHPFEVLSISNYSYCFSHWSICRIDCCWLFCLLTHAGFVGVESTKMLN